MWGGSGRRPVAPVCGTTPLHGFIGTGQRAGARPLKRAIQQQIENPLSKLILQGRLGPKDTIDVDVENGELAFR